MSASKCGRVSGSLLDSESSPDMKKNYCEVFISGLEKYIHEYDFKNLKIVPK
jgi:hypothetical protein